VVGGGVGLGISLGQVDQRARWPVAFSETTSFSGMPSS